MWRSWTTSSARFAAHLVFPRKTWAPWSFLIPSLQVAELQSSIDVSEEYFRLTLDSQRNKIMKMNLLLTLGTFSTACGGVVTGVFGMVRKSGNALFRYLRPPVVDRVFLLCRTYKTFWSLPSLPSWSPLAALLWVWLPRLLRFTPTSE